MNRLGALPEGGKALSQVLLQIAWLLVIVSLL
jgi:hypothetical protein